MLLEIVLEEGQEDKIFEFIQVMKKLDFKMYNFNKDFVYICQRTNKIAAVLKQNMQHREDKRPRVITDDELIIGLAEGIFQTSNLHVK